MVAASIRTVAEPVGVRFAVRGSRFLGSVAPVDDAAAARDRRRALHDDHPDATHVVLAYRLAAEVPEEFADDDGEPGGSAGAPALGVLRSNDLLDVAAVVVRHHGGSNLGYNGLVRAYSRAVSAALDRATVLERAPTARLVVEVGYPDSGTARSVMRRAGVAFEGAYGETVRFDVIVERSRVAALVEALNDATSGRATVERAPAESKGE